MFLSVCVLEYEVSYAIWGFFLGSEIFDLFIYLICVPNCKVSEVCLGLGPRFQIVQGVRSLCCCEVCVPGFAVFEMFRGLCYRVLSLHTIWKLSSRV